MVRHWTSRKRSSFGSHAPGGRRDGVEEPVSREDLFILAPEVESFHPVSDTQVSALVLRAAPDGRPRPRPPPGPPAPPPPPPQRDREVQGRPTAQEGAHGRAATLSPPPPTHTSTHHTVARVTLQCAREARPGPHPQAGLGPESRGPGVPRPLCSQPPLSQCLISRMEGLWSRMARIILSMYCRSRKLISSCSLRASMS